MFSQREYWNKKMYGNYTLGQYHLPNIRNCFPENCQKKKLEYSFKLGF